MKKGWTDDKIVKSGIVAACVIIGCSIFWMIASNLKGAFGVVKDFFGILAPILIGGVFAYLLSPIEKFLRVRLTALFSRKKEGSRRAASLARAASVTLSTLLLLACLYAVVAMIVPSLLSSLEALLSPEQLEIYYNTVDGWISTRFQGTPIETWFDTNFDGFMTFLVDTIRKIDFGALFSGLTGSVYSVISALADFLIGLVATVYLLIYREHLCAQTKKFCVAVFKPKTADRLFSLARRTNKIFGHYVMGTVIDMLFVMIVTYVAMLIMKMPYAPLISVIIGVTNIIPFFGPFLGWIPSALLLLVDNPWNALYFSIFILVLQQVEGNIIHNRIMGDRLGLSDLWVLFAILLFGGVFGFAGLLLGVPVFAVIYELISDALNRRLEKRRYPTVTDDYFAIQSVSDLAPTEPESESEE